MADSKSSRGAVDAPRVGTQAHWGQVYNGAHPSRLGWYEDRATSSLVLVDRCLLTPDDLIIDVGAGSSALIDHLLLRGFRNLAAIDVCAAALARTKERLGQAAGQIRWITDDISRPGALNGVENIGLWHDRALLHFLVDGEDVREYLNSLRGTVRVGGYVIIVCFAVGGAPRCSGLQVKNHNADSIALILGRDFELVDHFDHTHFTPGGEQRPYVYTLFRRVS
ncbi:MAG: class I SAM-dependent methyltransferase [Terriglobia bacterium]